MKTDIITVSSLGEGISEALRQADLAAAYKQLSGKQALQLRLLSEEALGMMRSITGEASGQFWIDAEKGAFQIHLSVETDMSREKRQELLSASTSGKNEAAKGLMGKIRDLFDRVFEGDTPIFDSPLMLGVAPQMFESFTWSLDAYREQLRAKRSEQGDEAWDELEKSVVANVADDVRVSIQGRRAELIIEKTFA